MIFLPSLIKPDSANHDITPTAAVLTLVSIVPQRTINGGGSCQLKKPSVTPCCIDSVSVCLL